jgi:hypothetical protein
MLKMFFGYFCPGSILGHFPEPGRRAELNNVKFMFTRTSCGSDGNGHLFWGGTVAMFQAGTVINRKARASA